ncbi:peptide ABC transporter permease [Phytohabitans rumicis]|uniref:Peptide ABC transporter permease n=2 Tax=Phytohabitans rumicis TaxID=1076125 RepID=A0A6V8LIE9_9ACTN|nr:peptide ABC transporter permease [Phytohabitans rumicis]
MLRYILGRLAQAVGVLWAVFTVTFVVLYLLPSNPVALLLAAGDVQVEDLSPEQLAALEAKYGLDEPVYVQYFDQLWQLVRLDFGNSISKNVPVSQLLVPRLGSTLALGMTAILLTVVVGVAVAYLAAYVQWRPARVLLRRLPAVGVSFPPFFIGLLLIQVFAFSLGWLPATGSDGWQTLILPAITMAIPTSAMLAQVLTRSLDDSLAEPYITTARAKGLSRHVVQARHALRNAALPALTLLGMLLGATVAEAVVVETVFTRDGLGRLAQEAVLAQDVHVVQAVVLVVAAAFVAINLVVDLIYPLIDPRVTHAHRTH